MFIFESGCPKADALGLGRIGNLVCDWRFQGIALPVAQFRFARNRNRCEVGQGWTEESRKRVLTPEFSTIGVDGRQVSCYIK